MKKVLLSFLLVFAVLSTVIFNPFFMEKTTADATTINIGSFSDLQNAVNVANQNQGNYIFNIVNNFDISAEEKVELNQSEVTLKGNNHTITVDSNLLTTSIADRSNPEEVIDNCFFVVKGNAKLNIGTGDESNKLNLKNTCDKENLYISNGAKYIKRIGVASKNGVVNIYEGTSSELGYSVAGTLNIYGGTFTDFNGPYWDRGGIQLDYVISTYSIDSNDSTAEVNIMGGTIENNYARAINIEGNSKCLINGSQDDPVEVNKNHIGYDGAGLLFNSSNTLTIKNALFTENKCESEPVYRPQNVGFGSAIHAKGGIVKIEDSTFTNNNNYYLYLYYSYINSTIVIDDSNYSINNCEISNNRDGVTLKNSASGTIKDSIISGNELPGINIKGTVTCNLKNTRITNNGSESDSVKYGGGIISNFAHNPDEADLGPASINCDEDTVLCNNKSYIAGADIFAYNTKLLLPEASTMGEKFEKTGKDIDAWYYDGAFSQVGPPLGPKRYGLTDTPILAEIEPDVAKDYSIIAAHYYENEETTSESATTEATTTEASTTVTPTTTVAPTTTAKPTTTVAPTTTVKPTTTAAPTTTVKPTTTAAPTTTEKPPLTGKCGNNIRYNVSIYEGTLYLTGTGNMYDYEAYVDQPPYYYYRDAIGKVVISDGITGIGRCAFRNFFRLYSVDIPDSVTNIGVAAFQHCESLDNVVVPSGVKRLEQSVFSWCTNMSNLTLPQGIKTIGYYAFEGNYKLKTMYLPEDTVEILAFSFLKCNKLEYLYVPDKVQYIDTNAFAQTSSDLLLLSVLKDSYAHRFCVDNNYNYELRSPISGSPAQPGVQVTTEAITTREETTKVLSGTCGDNINWVYDENTKTLELSGTGAMDDYTMINNTPSYASNLDVEKVVINDGITSIGDFAFYDFKNLETVEMSDSVQTIGACAFEGCVSLKNASLSKSLESIDDNAFFYCNDMEELTLPSSITSIGENVFDQYDGNLVLKVTPGSYAASWVNNSGYSYNDGTQTITTKTNATSTTTKKGTYSTTSHKKTTVAKPTIKYVKKKSAKKLKIKLKKSKNVKGYKVAVYKTKKNAKNNKKAIFTKIVNNTSFIIKSKKFKSKKKLYVRIKSYILVNKAKVYSPWSKIIKVKK